MHGRLVLSLALASTLAAQSSTPLTAELTAYLEISYAQVGSLSGLRAAYAAFVAEKTARSAEVRRELAEETAKPTLDATALGLRYVELEAIRRAIDEAGRNLIRESRAVLSVSQIARINGLIAAERLATWAREAECFYLISRAEPVASGEVPAPVFPGFFGCLADPLNGPSSNLTATLSLSREQRNSLREIRNETAKFIDQKDERRRIVLLEIGIEERRTVPDPNAVGVRYLELEAIRREIEAREDKSLQEVAALLTPEQKVAAAALAESRALARLAGQARCASLVDGPPTISLNPTFTYPGILGSCGGSIVIRDPFPRDLPRP